jgi:hypothetical protein
VALAALNGVLKQLAERLAHIRGNRLAMAHPDQRAGLHAELDRVIIEHRAVLPAPAEVPISAALRGPVLQPGGDLEQPPQSLGVHLRLAQSQGVGEQLARCEVRRQLLRPLPGAFATLGGVAHHLLAIRRLRADDCGKGQQCGYHCHKGAMTIHCAILRPVDVKQAPGQPTHSAPLAAAAALAEMQLTNWRRVIGISSRIGHDGAAAMGSGPRS